jgi:archaellin
MPNFLEFKYEDLMTNYNGTLSNMFKHYGFTKEMIKKSLEIASEFNIRKKDDNDLLKNGHITNKSIDLDKWKTYFKDPELIQKFRKIYPEDIFEKIGYPVDNLNLLENTTQKINSD